jgi:hypothetical protein
VDETTLTFETEMFDPAYTVEPAANPVPVIVTLIPVPTNPWPGLMPLIEGAPCTVAVAGVLWAD